MAEQTKSEVLDKMVINLENLKKLSTHLAVARHEINSADHTASFIPTMSAETRRKIKDFDRLAQELELVLNEERGKVINESFRPLSEFLKNQG